MKILTPLQMIKNSFKACLKECKIDYEDDLVEYGHVKGEDVFNFLQGLEFNDYENLAWFAGYLRAYEEIINLLENNK